MKFIIASVNNSSLDLTISATTSSGSMSCWSSWKVSDGMIADSKATATGVLGDKVIGDLDPGGVGDGVTTGREHGTGFKASKPGGGPGGVKEGESRIDLAGVTGGGVGDGGALKGAHAGGGPSGVYEEERIVE